MRQQDVMDSFIEGGSKAKSPNLKHDGRQLTHYYTVIAEMHPDGMLLNLTPYTKTTKAIQNKLEKTLDYYSIDYRVLTSIPMGCSDLSKYSKMAVNKEELV